MIGATLPAQPAPAPGPSAGAASDAATTAPEAAAPQAAGAAGRAAPARPDRPVAESGDTAAAVPAFADLLVQPPAPAPVPAAPAPAPPAAGHAGTGSGTHSPEHLLALLDGSRFGAGAAMAAPGTGPAGVASTLHDARPVATLSPAAAAAGLEPASAHPATATATVTAMAGEALAASTAFVLPEAGASARDLATATPADFTIEAPASPVATSATATPLAGARPQVAPVLPPLPMPADPAAGFDEGFGTRVVWMAEQRLGHAEIRLNPEHVGPIEVRVELDGEQVRAEFHSAHAEVRQAIEASVPRLRELLAQHGLQLGQADVGQGQAGREGADARSAASARGGDGSGAGEDMPPRPAPVRVRGLVDEYA